MTPPPRILDGALGTVLEAEGYRLDEPAWSARVVREAPEAVAAIHRAYAEAGATVHTTATFRTTPWGVGAEADRLTHAAVRLCRDAVPPDHTVLGSLAPVFDCWAPDASPADAAQHHAAQAGRLWAAGVDGILVETFAHVDEAEAAVRAALGPGPVWCALTPGFDGRLLSPAELAHGARRVHEAGAACVLVNCLPAAQALDWIAPVAALGIPWGVYPNGGPPGGPTAHGTPGAAHRFAALAQAWSATGASVIGGCCGTGPEHIRAIVETVSIPSDRR